MTKKVYKAKAKMVGVSPQAYEEISQQSFESKPRLKKREFINKLLKLPKEV